MKLNETKEKGDLGVIEVILDMTKHGYKIFTTISEHLPFDFVAFKDNKFLRIQAKYRTLEDSGKVSVPFRTSWSDKNGTHEQYYNKEDIDYIAVYCPQTDKCYYVDPSASDNKNALILRVENPKNGQTKGIKFADDYLLDSVETTRDAPEMVKI